MQSIKDTEFPEIGKRHNVVKISYAIIYFICATALSILTILLPMDADSHILLALLSVLLLLTGILFCWLRSDIRFYRPTGSLIAKGRIRIPDASAKILADFIDKKCDLPDTIIGSKLCEHVRLLYMLSYDRKFLAIQLMKRDEKYAFHPISSIRVLLNEQAAIASSRLRIKIEDI